MERAMFNFGAGNHVCLGQNIARMNILKLVPSLMRTYEVRHFTFFSLCFTRINSLLDINGESRKGIEDRE